MNHWQFGVHKIRRNRLVYKLSINLFVLTAFEVSIQGSEKNVEWVVVFRRHFIENKITQ